MDGLGMFNECAGHFHALSFPMDYSVFDTFMSWVLPNVRRSVDLWLGPQESTISKQKQRKEEIPQLTSARIPDVQFVFHSLLRRHRFDGLVSYVWPSRNENPRPGEGCALFGPANAHPACCACVCSGIYPSSLGIDPQVRYICSTP